VLQRRSAATEPLHYVATRSNGCIAHARTRTQRQTGKHTTQTNTHIANLTHANANERTHARTHGSRREREHCAALREDSQRRRQRRCDALQPAMRWRNRFRCAATGGASLQQVVRRCNRWCVVATVGASLQQVVRRCNSRCVVATGGASLLHDELSRCNAGGADASYIGAHLRCAVECDGLQARSQITESSAV